MDTNVELDSQVLSSCTKALVVCVKRPLQCVGDVIPLIVFMTELASCSVLRMHSGTFIACFMRK